MVLARALALHPKALLLDEPFSGLDIAMKTHLFGRSNTYLVGKPKDGNGAAAGSFLGCGWDRSGKGERPLQTSFLSRTVTILALGYCLLPPSLTAQNSDGCFFLCRPELKIEPTFTVEHLFSRHRVAEFEGDEQVGVTRAEREVVFETVLALEIPTEIPRVGFTFETIFIPFASGSENPFTGMTAQEIGRDSIRDNSPEVEIELNLEWLRSEDTGGWVGSHFDIVDKISPAERPQDAGAYTHKLNFELDTAVNIFNWLPEGNWLRNIELEGSLDYVATGLPRAGDRIGNELFLDNASGWSFSLVFVIPLAPLSP